VELVVSKLPACTTVEFRWKIQPVLEKTLHWVPNVSRNKLQIINSEKQQGI
jgi:hypothetical protein